MWQRYLVLILMLIASAFATERAHAQNGRYEPGQVWTYRSGEDANPSRIVVGKTETLFDLGPTVHVSIIGIPITDPVTGQRVFMDVWHVPFAVSALDTSVIEVENTAAVPEGFAEAYDNWRAGYDKGEAGVFTLPVITVLRSMREATVQDPAPSAESPHDPVDE